MERPLGPSSPRWLQARLRTPTMLANSHVGLHTNMTPGRNAAPMLRSTSNPPSTTPLAPVSRHVTIATVCCLASDQRRGRQGGIMEFDSGQVN
eukprot:8473756-Heterocapsa_arctica.AAC.2